MSMSTFVHGYKPTDALWRKYKLVWEACVTAQVPIPEEALKFFNYEDPGDKPGIEVDLPPESIKPYHSDSCDGFEVEVKKIPKDIAIIRFYNSW